MGLTMRDEASHSKLKVSSVDFVFSCKLFKVLTTFSFTKIWTW